MHLRNIVAVGLIALQSAAFALDPAVVGKWKMVYEGETSNLEIKADGTAVMEGEAIRIASEGGKLKMTYAAGVTIDAPYTVSGSTLTIDLMGDQETWTRVGAAPAAAPAATPPPPAKPAATPAPASGGNPLAKKKAAHPGVGTWKDEQLGLTLREEGGKLVGQLTLADQAYPTEATGTGADITGSFSFGGTKFTYTATIAGDKMELLSDGTAYHLTRVGAASAPPLAAATSAPAPASEAAPAPSSANMLKKPDDGFDLALPGDFHVVKEQAGMILLGSNVTPGLILVIPSPQLTEADLEKGGRDGLQTPEVQMAASAPGRDVTLAAGGKGKLVDVAGTLDNAHTQGLLGGFLRPGGGGVVLLAATTPENWPKLRPFAEDAMKGVRVYAPQVSDRLAKARQALAGHSLVYAFNNSTMQQNSSGYYTGSSINSFKAWHCCASGRGRYEGARSSSFQGGGIIGSSESSPASRDGKWTLKSQGDQFLLQFNFDSGESATWTVTVDANENVFVDGTKVKVTTDSICERL